MIDMEVEQAQDLYSRFMTMHPNHTEVYNPTSENIARWRWHINQSANTQTYEPVFLNFPESAQELARERAFSSFEQMPEYMQSKYLAIAARLPGIQFYACGSRVTGEYIETWSGEQIKKMRIELRKPAKTESDYDVYIEFTGVGKFMVDYARRSLPEYADLMTQQIPDNEKIAIPMWDFSKLPESEHALVIELYNAGNWGELMLIHNKYQLSPTTMCCDSAPAKSWFMWAIDNGIIK